MIRTDDLRQRAYSQASDRHRAITSNFGDSLTLAGIPPDVFRYRLGNRSALDWVIDQYQVKQITGPGGDRASDPNWPDDLEYIVRLVAQVVRVSMETVALVDRLPPLPEPALAPVRQHSSAWAKFQALLTTCWVSVLISDQS
jgi:predicted helicase